MSSLLELHWSSTMVVLKETHKHNGGVLLRFLLTLYFHTLNPSFDNNHFNLNHF